MVNELSLSRAIMNKRRTTMVRKVGLALALALLGLTACASIGPASVARDRIDYIQAISNSWKQMMLLNIVKIRYGDALVFLEVASVINQYALETEVSANAAWNAFLPEPSQTVGGRGRYSDRPTITYNPILGQKFTESLLKPIPMTGFASMIQAGYSAEFLFRVCVTAVNGIYNESTQRLLTREADPDFERLIAAITRIQQDGGLDIRIAKQGEYEGPLLYFRRDLSKDPARDAAEVKRLLGLDPNANEFRLSYGSMAADESEIAILTRSMLQITTEMAARVQVPESHVQENRASPGVFDAVDSTEKGKAHVKIESSTSEPEDPFVSIRYRDHWFFIDDRDISSKRMFSFLMLIFTLVEKGEPAETPSLTLPAA
jgi:hypothetical protein